jgi:assimilatory nitrate reductase catalytic subunit
VDAAAIERHAADCAGSVEERLASVQDALRCGTNCGSCVPELKRIVRGVEPLRQVA